MSFVPTMLSLSFAGAALCLLIIALRLSLGRRLPSAFYYYAWVLVLLRMLIPLPGLVPQPEKSAPPPPAVSIEQPLEEAKIREPRLPDEIAIAGGWAAYDETTAADAAPAQEAQSAANMSPEAAAPSPAPLGTALKGIFTLVKESGLLLPVLWAIGVIVMLLWYLLGYARFSRLCQSSLAPAPVGYRRLLRSLGGSKRLRLYTSPHVSGPMLMGLLHPRLILPQRDYSPDMLENILRHELTHYRRGDLAVKWFAVVVCCLRWFDPVVYLVMSQLDRDCELSCDERLLRSMDVQARRRYGDTLLTMAQEQIKPRRMVSTCFSTEKRNLKERLYQIMRYKDRGMKGLALLLAAVLLLGGCSAALGPKGSEENAPPPPDSSVQVSPSPTAPAEEEPAEARPEQKKVSVSTVDQLLSSIAPYTSITLEPGKYDLTAASGYGESGSQSSYYSWEPAYDGSELVISGVEGLQLIGMEGAEIITQPRYANVLHFKSCADIAVSGLSLGHSPEKGSCSGGVIKLSTVDGAIISQCGLYGCGTLSLDCQDSRNVQLVESMLYDCSNGAALVRSSCNVLINNCKVFDNQGYSLFDISSSENVAVINCALDNNKNMQMLSSADNSELLFAGNIVNDIYGEAMFFVQGAAPVVKDCKFGAVSKLYFDKFGPCGQVLDGEGKAIDTKQALATMEHAPVESWEPAEKELPQLHTGDDGYIEVSTADEFLAAIAPGSKIRLLGSIDLSTASSFGGFGSEYYSWSSDFDGPQLNILNVEDLCIEGLGADKSSILTKPRYAEVLAFHGCTNIKLNGFTMGHTLDQSSCMGGVLYLSDCEKVDVESCSLFGCGVWGITGFGSSDISVKDTEIYECSNGDLNFNDCKRLSFTNCNIHHNGNSRIISNCEDATLDGEPLESFGLDLSQLNCVSYIDKYGQSFDCASGLRVDLDYVTVLETDLPKGQPLSFHAALPVDGYSMERPPKVDWSVEGEGVELYTWDSNRCTVTNSGRSGTQAKLTASVNGESWTVLLKLK